MALVIALAAHGGIAVGAARLPEISSLFGERRPHLDEGVVEVDLDADPIALPATPPARDKEVPLPELPREEIARTIEKEKPASPVPPPAPVEKATPVVPAAPAERADVTPAKPEVAAEHPVIPPAAPAPAPATPPPPAAAPAGVASPPAVAAATPLGSAPGSPVAAATGLVPGGGARVGTGAEHGPDEYADSAPLAPLVGTGWSLLNQVALAPAGAAPTTGGAPFSLDPDAANRVLRSTMRSHDKTKSATLSTPAAGVVQTAIDTTVRALPLAHNTRATFEVTLGANGKVVSSRVVSSSGGDATLWDAASKTVATSLASQSMTLGPGLDKGVVVRVSIVQKHVYVTGGVHSTELKPVCANGIINEIVDATAKTPDATSGPTVPLFQDENGRPCIPVGVGGTADAANIGTEKHIEVRSSVQVTVPGEVDLPDDIQPVNTDAPWVEVGKAGPRPNLPQRLRKRQRDQEKKK